MENKTDIVQSILMHFVLSKKKVLLDQLREGLRTLGVLEEAIKYPLLFEKLFVRTESDLHPEEVKAILKFPEQMGGSEVATREMLLRFIDDCSINSKKRNLFNIITISEVEVSTVMPFIRKHLSCPIDLHCTVSYMYKSQICA